MATSKTIAEFFLISIAWALTFFSPIAPARLTGEGFHKLLANVSIGALLTSVIIGLFSTSALSWPLSLPLILKCISLLALVGSVMFCRDGQTPFVWIMYAVIVSNLAFHLLLFLPPSILLLSFSSLFLLSSALLLGIITYAMLLGHWYLVVPKLSERPLKIAAIITWIILGLKITTSLWSIYSHYSFFEEQTQLGSGYAFNWLLLSMRLSFGYLVILGMSLLNWKLVKMRSIQSSTGILYAMTFFVFIGELVSLYLFFSFGLLI